ncbi:MAG: aldehyde dehydrogenase family protein, partial [Actinomycetota bacterium]|nr:aldehyde dehydrogenase family protein [Actinomycetota bacterium]MED5233143.1 aldehyde dehydrogenase family protein [Actinomycetota bacterium]MEE3354685.1 aldehyde dehydrogenase family protein [Actinomycetota bacterium]
MALDLTDPAALAASLEPPSRALIGGRSVESASGRTFATLNPATGAELAQVAECDATDVDRAVAAARTAFEDGPWGRMAPSDRKRLILRFASLVEAHTDEL